MLYFCLFVFLFFSFFFFFFGFYCVRHITHCKKISITAGVILRGAIVINYLVLLSRNNVTSHEYKGDPRATYSSFADIIFPREVCLAKMPKAISCVLFLLMPSLYTGRVWPFIFVTI